MLYLDMHAESTHSVAEVAIEYVQGPFANDTALAIWYADLNDEIGRINAELEEKGMPDRIILRCKEMRTVPPRAVYRHALYFLTPNEAADRFKKEFISFRAQNVC